MSPLTEPTKIVLAKDFTWNETVWNPSMIQTTLWLDAADASTITESGGAVSQWNDKSGNGRNATQATAGNRPTVLADALNGRQGVQFSTTGKWLQVIDEAPFDFTSTLYVFTVASISNTANGNVLINKGRSTYSNAGWYVDLSGSYQSLVGITSNASWSALDPGTSLSANTPGIFSYEINGATVRARLDGTTRSTVVGNKVAWVAATNNHSLLIGAYDINNFAADYEGLAHQIIIMSSVPPLSTIEKLEGWAAHYYGLTANLPAGHPYKTVGPTP
jgi:hypothetical protein